MGSPLDTLLENHRHTERLLGALEYQVAIFADGGAPDYDVMAGVAEYFIDYPGLCHHPLEDAIAARLLATHPSEAGAVADLAGEHKVAHEWARRFRRTVNALLHETDIPRDEVVVTARRFITFQRRHMRLEEESFFPLAERLLTAEDWRAIEDRRAGKADPVLGAEIAASFGSLRERLLRWQAEDEAEDAQGRAT